MEHKNLQHDIVVIWAVVSDAKGGTNIGGKH